LGGGGRNKLEDQYSRLQKTLRKGGGEQGETLVGHLEREGRGMRVRERGKIGGWQLFPFIIPTTCGNVNRRPIESTHHPRLSSLFFFDHNLCAQAPGLRPQALCGWNQNFFLFFHYSARCALTLELILLRGGRTNCGSVRADVAYYRIPMAFLQDLVVDFNHNVSVPKVLGDNKCNNKFSCRPAKTQCVRDIFVELSWRGGRAKYSAECPWVW